MPPLSVKRMPFLAHFAELRRRLTVVVAVVGVLTVAFYFQPFYGFLTDLLLDPIRHTLPNGGKLNTIGPFEALTLRFQVGLVGAVIIASPLILYEIFAFFAPALKQRERKWVLPTVAAAIALFLSGVAFFYFVLFEPAFVWLAQQGAGVTEALPRATDYMGGIAMLLIGFGISFELPLVVFYLIGLSVLPYHRVRESWRVAYVLIFVLAAVATPDWSPYNMFGLAGALILLFEGSLLAARLIFARKITQQAIDTLEEEEPYWEPTDDAEELKRREKIRQRAAAARKKSEASPSKPVGDTDA
jgi:sec-independent protein translocase protein TatC